MLNEVSIFIFFKEIFGVKASSRSNIQEDLSKAKFNFRIQIEQQKNFLFLEFFWSIFLITCSQENSY